MEKEIEKENGVFKVAVPVGTALLAFHLIAVMNDWYRSIPLIDAIFHFGATVVFGLGVYWLIVRFPGHLDLSKNLFVTLLAGASLAALGAVLWEFGEYIYDAVALALNTGAMPVQLSIADTMKDLMFNILGGLAVAIFARVHYHRRRK